jgi:putative drug exporter of the RND superfamily
VRESAPPSRLMDRWIRGIVRFRWLVFASWIVIFVLSQLATMDLANLWRSEAGLPGTDAQRVEDVLQRDFGQRSYASFTLVARANGGSAADILPAVAKAAQRAAGELPTAKVTSVQSISNDAVSATIASTLDVPKAHPHTEDMRAAIGTVPGATTWLTGAPALAADTMPVAQHDLAVGELFIALPVALLILAFIFGTLAFLLPFLFAAAAIPATLALVWAFAHRMGMEQTVQNLVTFIGLGIAIDYSLLIVYRYREELKRGGSREDAVVRTMQTAGRAVVFSGTAVAIGLGLLLLVPVPGIRGYGVAGLLIPLVSVATALTLLPALLYSLEAKLDRVRVVPKRVLARRESTSDEENFWLRWAHTIMRHPGRVLAGSLALLVLFTLPVVAMEIGPGTNEQLPAGLESTQGLRVLEEEVGAGALNPSVILVDTGRAHGIDDVSIQSGVARLTAELSQDPEVALVRYEPNSLEWVDRSGRYLRMEVVGRSDPGVQAAEDFVTRTRDTTIPTAAFADDVKVMVGGAPAFNVDFLDKTYSAFPWLVLGVLALTYFLLLRAFRSVLLPLKAIVLVLLSVGAAYGLMVAVFKWGLGSPFGLIEYDQITGWIPVFLFAMLFGLSMDYEVFLVSRMREVWDATHDNERAVAEGLAKTGRLVTAAGLIMFAAFMGLAVGSFVDLQQFGFGLAAAIIIDVTIVRALVLPSAMALFGRWNWWLPSSVARVARVEPSELQPRASEAPQPTT